MKPTVSLSMIVRDEAPLLRRCLESVRGAVDNIVVGDTGSRDESREVAREHGARVIDIPWKNDFALARNLALAETRGDWVLSLDADEMLDQFAAGEIQRLITGNFDGYQVPIRNYLRSMEERIWNRPAQRNADSFEAARSYPAYVDHENVRLFRRDPQIYFVGRVHESVGSRIESQRLGLGTARFRIHHFGLAADDEAIRQRKTELYRELGRQKASELPDNAQAQLELGLAEMEVQGNIAAALESFIRACDLNSRLGVAWFFRALAELRLGHPREALKSVDQAENFGQENAASAELRGDAFYDLGNFLKAWQSYQKALQFQSTDPGICGKLALAHGRLGHKEEGIRGLRNAIKNRPDFGPNHDRLVQLLAWSGLPSEAAVAAEQKLRSVSGTKPEDFQRCAVLWAGQGEWPRATAILHVGLQIFPANPLLDQAMTQLSECSGSGVNQIAAALRNSG